MSQQSKTPRLISDVIGFLNDNVEYAVLRNYEGLPYSNAARDIDIIIRRKDLRRIQHDIVGIIEKTGWKIVTYLNSDRLVTFVCARNDGQETSIMQWDFFVDTSVFGILLMSADEFLSDKEGKEVIRIAEAEEYIFSGVMELGKEYYNGTWALRHIDMVKNLPLVDVEAIAKADFSVVVDGINSIGGAIIPQLLRSLGVKNVIELNCEPTGKFAHTPEPVPENLYGIAGVMREAGADVGFVVDPDVDRLAIVMENGEMFIEENTLIAIADYVLGRTPGNTVSNLSSSRGLRDVTEKHNSTYHAAAVGEVNVVTRMKEVNAVIGGEGNGGVIYPALHYGRDALVGVALFLTLMARSGKSVSGIKASLPAYAIAKNKIQLTPDIDVDAILEAVKEKYSGEKITDIDGVKIDFPTSWVHLRKSNTEPIIRIYSEAPTMKEAEELAESIKSVINEIKTC